MRETGEDMNWWQMETKEAARRLETDEKQGLTFCHTKIIM